MSDWTFLNKYRVTTGNTSIPPYYQTVPEDGFSGMFRFLCDTKFIRCLASDGGGWQHVSVTVEGDNKPPVWGIMCRVKDLFWEDSDWVIQFHPAKDLNVNYHPFCLHLWRYTGGGPFEQPTPHAFMVGPKAGKQC